MIMCCDFELTIGQIVRGLTSGGPNPIHMEDQPILVIREATEQEFIHYCNETNTEVKQRFPYYYEVSTD